MKKDKSESHRSNPGVVWPVRLTRIGVGFVFISLMAMFARSEQDLVPSYDKLELEDAISLAQERNPVLRSYEWQIRAREAEVKQAGLLPNPSIEVEAESFGGNGEFSGTDAAEYSVLLSQPLIMGGKRSKERRIADADRSLAEWSYKSIRRDLIRDVTTAYTAVLENQEHVNLAEELVKLSEELVDTAKRRVESGGASVVEQTKAEIERVSSLANEKQIQQSLVSSRRQLATLLRLSETELPPISGNFYQIFDLPDFEVLKEGLAKNPEWIRWGTEVEKLEAAAALADAQSIPDVDVSVGWRRDEGADADSFIIAAGIPLPLFNRNQGAREAAVHERASAIEERAAAELELERGLVEAYSELSQAHAQAKAIMEEILPAANRSFEVSREGYLQGRFGYLDLLDAQRTLFETKGQYVEILRAYHQARAEIERLTNADSESNNLTTEE